MKRQLALLISLCCIAACAGGGSCAAKKKVAGPTPDTFIWSNGTEPDTLDPALCREDRSANIIYALFEGLTEYDPQTGKPVPAVATSWEVSPDGLTYTFHLRDNAKWSDGAPVTAADFEYSWKRALDPHTASQSAYMLYFVKGAEDYSIGKTTDPATVAVKATGLTTLVTTLKNPTPFFPELLAFTLYRPVPRQAIEAFGDKWTRPENMITNGAFKLISWMPQKEVVVEKSPTYWDAANVKLARGKFLPVESTETSLKLFLNGEVSYTKDLQAVQIPKLRKRRDCHDNALLATDYYQFNTARKPFDDPRVRLALNLAIDRALIAKTLQRGDIAQTSLVPPIMMGYQPATGLGYDPARAKQLLSEAGFTDPKTFPRVTVSYNTNEVHKQIVEMLQNMWKTNLGIEVGMQNFEWKVLLPNYVAKNFDIGRNGWIGDYTDPLTFLNVFTATSQQNTTSWTRPEYDALLDQAAAEVDPAKRASILAQAEGMMLGEAPIIPLFQESRPYLLDPRVKGFYGNARDLHPLKYIYFEE